MIKNNLTSHFFPLAWLLFIVNAASYSQVKIGDNVTTIGAGSLLELESTNKALVVTRVASTAAIASPVNGMVVYDISSHCIKTYGNGAWSECYTSDKSTIAFFNSAFDSMVKGLHYGDGTNNFVYKPITGEDGRIWLSNNLGADYANTQHPSFNFHAQATAADDHHAYGSLFQWGRGLTGHEQVDWTSSTAGTRVTGTTTTNTSLANHELFIIETTAPFDWTTHPDDTFWSSTSIWNPCPPGGYRVPTDAELTAYVLAAGITNSATAASSDIALSSPGYVDNDAVLTNIGTGGYYWSNTPDGSNALLRHIDATTTNSTGGNRAKGHSVRCIKN